MQRSAEFDLTLDIDDLAAAEPDLCRDPARVTKGETTEHDHRETVHLADDLAGGLDADSLAADLLLQAAIDPVAAAELGIDGALHLGRCDDVFASRSGQLVGLL
jgi:hypothetical protein